MCIIENFVTIIYWKTQNKALLIRRTRCYAKKKIIVKKFIPVLDNLFLA
jgi:hypothetical protein